MTARRPRVQTRLTWWGGCWLGVAAALITTGLIKNINLILLLAYFLVALVVWNWFHCRWALRKLTISRVPSPPVFSGDQSPCEYWLENQSGADLGDLAVEDAPFGRTHQWHVPPLPKQSKSQFVRLANSEERGRFEAEPCVVNCVAPFGLVRSQVRAGQATVSWVYPRRGIIDIDRLRSRLPARGIGRERRRALVPLPADGTDIYGLHPYRPGDSPRLIHWKTTARVGEIMVREFDRNTAPDMAVVVDGCWVSRDSGRRWEAALEFLSTLIWSWGLKTDACLHVALPDGNKLISVRIAQRSDAHVALRRLAAAEWKPGADRWIFSYDAVPEQTPIVVIGATVIDGRRGITVDPMIVSNFYRPAGL